MEAQFALIGYGEAGAAFARAAGWSTSTRVFDIDPRRNALAEREGLAACGTAAEALSQASLVLSLVAPDAALSAVLDYNAFLAPGTIWCDMTSVAPETKRWAAVAVETAGGRYVDAAIMAPVDPAALDVPILLAGDAAPETEDALGCLGYRNLRCVGRDIGRASAIKMIRSIMVKGIEALTDEMMQAADVAGVTEDVLASLDASEREKGWRARAEYNLGRMDLHGRRRAAEMEEVARTLVALGVNPLMTRATMLRQLGRGRGHGECSA